MILRDGHPPKHTTLVLRMNGFFFYRVSSAGSSKRLIASIWMFKNNFSTSCNSNWQEKFWAPKCHLPSCTFFLWEIRHYSQDGEGLGWGKTSFMYYLCLGFLLFCQNLIDPKHHDGRKREEVRRKIRQKGSAIIYPQNIFHNCLLIFHVLHRKSLKQKWVNLLVWTELQFANRDIRKVRKRQGEYPEFGHTQGEIQKKLAKKYIRKLKPKPQINDIFSLNRNNCSKLHLESSL